MRQPPGGRAGRRRPAEAPASGATAGPLTHHVDGPCADEGADGSKVMIEEGQRSIGGERGEPE